MCHIESHGEIKFNLFELHDSKIDDCPEKWICASKKEVGQTVSELVNSAVVQLNISKRDLSRQIAQKLNISILTSDRLVSGRKDWLPLCYILELIKIVQNEEIKRKIIEQITYLKVSQPPLKIVKTPKFLTLDLYKIVGAHAADGTLAGNYFCITDGDRLNLIAFQKWLLEEFELSVDVHQRGENEWAIRFHNKIFSRYLLKFFGFPSGRKCESVGMPAIIANSNANLRRGFAIGSLGFEAGLGAGRDVSLCVLSKKFKDDLAAILIENGLQFTDKEGRSGNYWRFWSGNLSKEDAANWMPLFEPNTEKWHKLQEYANGYQGKTDSLEHAVNSLNRVYPKLSASKVTTSDVLLAIKELNEAHRYKIIEKLKQDKQLSNYGGKWGHSLRHHLDVLKETNMIKVQKRGFGTKKSFGTTIREVYAYNPNCSEWVVPKREELEKVH